jgi:hypothetical protein
MPHGASSGRDHYCFIIHDNLPYCYDLNSVLALPSGFRYRNRFSATWVEANLHGDISALEGAEVLIILRVQEQNLLIPARWGTIKVAQQVGSIYYFEYILGDLIQYSENLEERQREITAATRQFAETHVWLPGTEGTALGSSEPSVFRSVAGRGLKVASADDLTLWGNSVAAITTAKIYERAEFLKILGLFDLKGNASAVADENYRILPNTVYQLRVFQYVPVPGETPTVTPHDIDVATFGDHFVQLRPKQRAVGKYDMLSFELKTRRLPPKERSAIVIPYNPAPAAPTESGSYAPGALYVPIIIKGRPSVTLLLLIILAAALVGMFAPKVYPGNEVVVRNLSTVIFVLIVSGWKTTLDALFPNLPWAVAK